jgi:hypothetical protein
MSLGSSRCFAAQPQERRLSGPPSEAHAKQSGGPISARPFPSPFDGRFDRSRPRRPAPATKDGTDSKHLPAFDFEALATIGAGHSRHSLKQNVPNEAVNLLETNQIIFSRSSKAVNLLKIGILF